MRWTDAAAACIAEGGHLASVTVPAVRVRYEANCKEP